MCKFYGTVEELTKEIDRLNKLINHYENKKSIEANVKDQQKVRFMEHLIKANYKFSNGARIGDLLVIGFSFEESFNSYKRNLIHNLCSQFFLFSKAPKKEYSHVYEVFHMVKNVKTFITETELLDLESQIKEAK